METRAYDPDRDREGLWTLKQAFERELGGETDDAETRDAYEAKLTQAYRDRYLDWVERCVAESPRCVQVAEDDGPVGYSFVLPGSFALVWDAAVLNEIYVVPARRGTAVADRLLEAAVETARDQNLPMDRIVLDVAPANERAQAFYDRHGFEPWGDLVAREL